MRHSKAQTLPGPDGVERPILYLPELHTLAVVVELADPSERAVYVALEAFYQEEVRQYGSTSAALLMMCVPRLCAMSEVGARRLS